MSFKDLARAEPVRKRLHPNALTVIESGQFPYQSVGQYLDAEAAAAATLSRIRVSGVVVFDEIALHDLLWAICYLSAHVTDEASPKVGFSPASTREKLETENFALPRLSYGRPENAMVSVVPAHNIASTKKRMSGDATQESASIIQDLSLPIAKLVDGFQADIVIEKTELQRLTGKKYSLVTNYQLTQRAGAFYYYSIWISDELRLQEEDSVILVSAKQRIDAHLITAIDSQNFLVRTSEQLTQDLYKLRRAFDPAFILVALSQSLSRVRERTSVVASLVATKLLGNPRLSLADVSHWPISLNTSQIAAIKAAENWRVSFIWGPPGTGKTFTLGHVIYRAYLRSETVLVLSTSNVAIDQA
ncbi:AAA domain-containing protein, partial [uncultured Thiodictyon sp.]|uniref:AAA domain-containing protein n=1 Tax=uncultured Thiodictyon sp. TaxID=1846217 RepID=UPI0025F81836